MFWRILVGVALVGPMLYMLITMVAANVGGPIYWSVLFVAAACLGGL